MIFNQMVDDRKVRVFSLSPVFIDQYRNKQPNWGYDGLGYFTYKRTYSRDLPDGTTEEYWQTCQRVVEGCFNIQKTHCRQLGMPWNEQKAQASAQDMYKRVWEFKFTPPGRGLWAMGTDAVYQRGAGVLLNCFAGETEIITANGIQPIGPLVGTIQTLLTEGGKWVDAPINSFGKQKLWRLILSRQGVEKVIYTTKEHRWFARDRRQIHRNKGHVEFKTCDLRPKVHHLQYVFGKGIKGGVKASPFGISHGFTFGDGTVNQGLRNAASVTLMGDKDVVLRPYFNGCPEQKRDGGVSFGSLPNFFKTLPSIRENKSYLLGWLIGYFAADGSLSVGGSPRIFSVKKENIEFVRDVCAVLGIGTYAIRKETHPNEWAPTGMHTLYSIGLMQEHLNSDFFLIENHKIAYNAGGMDEVGKRYWSVVSVEETDLEEEVFCATVEGYGCFALADNILTGNCSYISTEGLHDDFAGPFCFLMDMSMLGVGVGSDTRGVGKVKIQPPKTTTEPFVVADSREGWVDLIKVLLNSFVGRASYPLVIDYSGVRGRGELLKTLGGVSSGPKPLQTIVEGITKTLLPKGMAISFDVDYNEKNGKIGKVLVTFNGEGASTKITSVQIVDLFNYIAKGVVAGGIRRSASIMFGEPNDQDFLDLKQDKEALEDRRWASNNSVFGYIGMDYEKVVDAITVNGEPGIFWLENARKFSRMKDAPDNKDRKIMGTNPCCEMALESGESCNLVECYPAHHDSYEDFQKTLKMAYLYAKTVTLIPTHEPKSNAVMMRNRRIGCSMSGITQAIGKLGRREFLNWCDKGYSYIQELDKIYSDWLGIPLSIKTTTVKPSGSVSLLAGATPGIHYPHSEYYIRHVRVANTSPLVKIVKDAGYPVHPDAYADETSVVAFPIHEKFFLKGKDDVTVWEQFMNMVDMQAYWTDNQVSCTITYKKDEKKDIVTCMETFEDKLKSVSLLPLMEKDHGYKFPPYQAITAEQYATMMSRITPINIGNKQKTHDKSTEDKYCTGDKCEIDWSKAGKKE